MLNLSYQDQAKSKCKGCRLNKCLLAGMRIKPTKVENANEIDEFLLKLAERKELLSNMGENVKLKKNVGIYSRI